MKTEHQMGAYWYKNIGVYLHTLVIHHVNEPRTVYNTNDIPIITVDTMDGLCPR